MSSPYYDVTVVEREGCRLVLDVQCVHPDYLELPEFDFSMVMVIRDGASEGDPISEQVTREMLIDTDWDDAERFIRSMRMFDVRNRMVPLETSSAPDHPYWDDPTLWPAARYTAERRSRSR